MLDNINIQNILFLDIETIPQHPSFSEVKEEMQKLWEKKSKQISRDQETPESIYKQAGIYAEFGKIICISCGYLNADNKFRIKSFYGDDEKKILNEFAEMLNRFFSSPDKLLCAHNGREFDFPFLARRMVVNSIKLPAVLNTAGKNPGK